MGRVDKDVQQCYVEARNRGYTIFAVQQSGKCLGQGPNEKYDEYGHANTCQGGNWKRKKRQALTSSDPMNVYQIGNLRIVM